MSTAWNETDLDDLCAFFYQEGRHAALASFCGASLITHPDNPDPNQQALYTGCCELERRGLVQSRVLPDGQKRKFYGPSDWEWATAEVTAALGIPAELLRNDEHPNRS